jgi:hypothetical protein
MANAHWPNSPRTSAKALVALTIGSVPECLISAQAPNSELCYRLNPRGNSACGKLATKSPRKVLRSSHWARHSFKPPLCSMI